MKKWIVMLAVLFYVLSGGMRGKADDSSVFSYR